MGWKTTQCDSQTVPKECEAVCKIMAPAPLLLYVLHKEGRKSLNFSEGVTEQFIISLSTCYFLVFISIPLPLEIIGSFVFECISMCTYKGIFNLYISQFYFNKTCFMNHNQFGKVSLSCCWISFSEQENSIVINKNPEKVKKNEWG